MLKLPVEASVGSWKAVEVSPLLNGEGLRAVAS